VKIYWITGSIKNCQRRFVEQFGGWPKPAVETLHSTFSEKAYLIFSCYQLPFCEFPKYTTALHYIYDMQMYCTFLPFVNQHFPGLPASGTHCIIHSSRLVLSSRHSLSLMMLQMLCKLLFVRSSGFKWSNQRILTSQPFLMQCGHNSVFTRHARRVCYLPLRLVT
jgi:hypothetical protein